MELPAHLLSVGILQVVFLRRRNLLEAVVSSFIAEQTGLWSAWDRDLETYYTDLVPAPLEDVRNLLTWTRDNLAEVADILCARDDGRAPSRRHRANGLSGLWLSRSCSPFLRCRRL